MEYIVMKVISKLKKVKHFSLKARNKFVIKQKRKKLKNLYIYVMTILQGSQIIAPLAGPAVSVILPLPAGPSMSIERVITTEAKPRFKDFIKVALIFIDNFDKIVLTDQKIEQFDIIAKKCMNSSITMEKAILQLRSGHGLTDVVAIMIFVTFMNWLDGAKSFQINLPPHMDPMGWLQGSYNQPKTGSYSKSPAFLQITRPTTMPHQEFVGLTKEERRQLPHTNDMKLNYEGHPELNVGF